MDARQLPPISATDLYAVLGTAAAPVIIDVRPDKVTHALAGAACRSAREFDQWAGTLPKGRAIVVYHEVDDASRSVADALRQKGLAATHLAGGLKAWTDARLPLRRTRGVEQQRSKWVTREHPKIDRIACPWL